MPLFSRLLPVSPVLAALIGSGILSAQATAKDHLAAAEQKIAACEQKSGDNRFALHHCLLDEYERLQKRTDQLTDKMLGTVGAHHKFGRLKIIQWSNAITKSQSRWQKFLPWDCEWEGHILPTAKGAAVAIDRCGIKRAAKRVQLLEKRLEALTIAIENDNRRGK